MSSGEAIIHLLYHDLLRILYVQYTFANGLILS